MDPECGGSRLSRITIRIGEDPTGVSTAAPVWLHQVADYGKVRKVDRYPLGDWSLSWEQQPFRGANLSAFEQGRVVEAWHGGTRIWGGTLDAVTEDGRYSASGFCRQAERAYALDGAGRATADAGAAIFFASNSARKAWNVGSLIDFASWSNQLPTPEQPQKIAALLDQLCALNSARWWVGHDRAVRTGVDDMTPRMFINSAETLGASSETLATHLLVWHFLASGAFTVTEWGVIGSPLRIERLVDASGLGPITVTAAQNLARQVLTEVGPMAAFTNSITVSRGEVLNDGGSRVGLSEIKAGITYRINGMPDPRTGAPSTDVLMGEAAWDEEEGTVQLTPLGAERDDLSAVIEGLGMTLEAA